MTHHMNAQTDKRNFDFSNGVDTISLELESYIGADYDGTRTVIGIVERNQYADVKAQLNIGKGGLVLTINCPSLRIYDAEITF